MTPFADAIQNFADWLFMPWVVAVLMGGGLFLTLRLGVVQVRRFGEAVRGMLARSTGAAAGVLTPFQAFMTGLRPRSARVTSPASRRRLSPATLARSSGSGRAASSPPP
jgi:Na+/alanine symporter